MDEVRIVADSFDVNWLIDSLIQLRCRQWADAKASQLLLKLLQRNFKPDQMDLGHELF